MTGPNVAEATAPVLAKPATTNVHCITDEYAGRNEAAAYLRVCKKTLERWQADGTGPAITKVGRTVYYRRETLRAWVASRELQPTLKPLS
jgi:excisionase family DNA binding protein